MPAVKETAERTLGKAHRLYMDHGVLKAQLRRKVKDRDLLWLLDVFIDHPVPWTQPGKGVPIGNLTSQHFANCYLSILDHFIKEQLRIEGYARYMGDLVLWADEKDTLQDAGNRIETHQEEKLLLRVKPGTLYLAPVLQGLPFLGFRIFPAAIRNNNTPDNRNNNLGLRLSSSRQRPVAVRSRMHRLRQCLDHRPGPVPAPAGPKRPTRRRSVAHTFRTSPPGLPQSFRLYGV